MATAAPGNTDDQAPISADLAASARLPMRLGSSRRHARQAPSR